MPHQPVKLHFSKSQIAKIRKGMPIQLAAHAIGNINGHSFQTLHPSNLQKLSKANRSGKGVRITLTPAELEGTGILDALRSGFNWIKKNSNVLKPIASAVLDAGASFYPASAPVRGLVKKLTGVGVDGHSMHDIEGPQFFPGGDVGIRGGGPRRKPVKRRVPKRGSGIIPAGY